MSTLAVILIVLGALVVVLFLGGVIAARRRRQATEGRFRTQLEAANEALADAHAADKGWDRALLEQAVRDAVPGPVDDLHLLEVVDRPGTDADEAVFRIAVDGREETVRLGRREGAWYRVS